MAITGVNNYNGYTNYDPSITNKRTEEKGYSSVREYRSYLTEKYECLSSKDYSVAINPSFLQEAAGDEKKAKWLEDNLALTPKTIEQMKKWAAANGCEVLSCNITINGYDSMTQETVVRDVVDPGTEKAKKRQEERTKKIKEEKKAAAEKLEKQRAKKKEQQEKQYHMKTDGKDVADLTGKLTKLFSASHAGWTEGGYQTLDLMA